MLQALNSSSASSFSKLFVTCSTFLSFIHLSFSSNSTKMEAHRSPYAARSKQGSRSSRQSASLGNSSLNIKAAQLSLTNPSQRSRSPQSVESQRMQTFPKKAIGASPEKGPGSEPEDDPFDICRPPSAGPVKLKKSLFVSKRERTKELESQRMQTSQSLNIKVAQPSLTNPSQRSRSPQSVESQRMQASPKKAIGASPEKGPGSEPEEDPFDICRPASAGPVKLKKSLFVSNRERTKELEGQRMQTSQSLDIKVAQPSLTNPSQRSRSPQSVESQRMQTSLKKAIGASPEKGPGSEPEEVPFDICRPASAGPVKLKKPTFVSNRERTKELEGQRMQTSQSLNIKVAQPSLTNPSQRSRSPQSVESQRMQTSPKKAIGTSPEKGPGSEPVEVPFDIYRPASAGPVKLKKTILASNKERKKVLERLNVAPPVQHLRPGMVLLKNFIDHMNQVKIVNKCRELGISSGGFYRPAYRDGAKLHLQMMCLGKDWDPESRSYNQSRSFDGAVPPEIPVELRKLVDEALNASNKFLRKNAKNVEEIPKMSPDICIVNFYSNNGRLGLHQDRDESEESLKKGLPVVSFSIGDSAEFLYSEARDVDKAEKVMLESGDVLIFGGSSRHIFHGVPSIKPNTAPAFLTEEANLIPGHLNLTFRQYQ